MAILRAMRAVDRRVVWGGAAGLAILSAVSQLPLLDRNFVPMDEGHLALTASRLLDGDLLYRDIHTGIFPGIYLLAAGLFAVFGEDVIVTRFAQCAVNAATVALLFTIGLRLVPLRWAVIPALLFVALGWISFPVLTMFNYAALSGLFGLAALLAALRYADAGRRADGAAIGLLVGLCLFTKQNYGGLAAVGIAAGLSLARPGSGLASRSWTGTFRPVVAAGSAFLLVAIGWLATTGVAAAWVDTTFLSLVGPQLERFDNPIPPIFGPHPEGDARFVFLYIPSSLFDFVLRGDPFLGRPLDLDRISTLVRLFYGLPLAALVAATARLAWTAGRRAPDRERAAELLLVCFAVAFFFGIFPSAVYSHLAYVLAPVLLLFAWLGRELEAALARRSVAGARAWLALAWTLTAAALAAAATIPPHVRGTYTAESGLPHVSLRVMPGQAKLHAEAMEFIAGCATPGEPIFTLPILPVLYLASGHPNPVKWDLLIPGSIDEHAIVAVLARERVRCVVRQRDMSPEFPKLSELYPTLDAYVRRNYRRGRALEGAGQLWHGLVRTTPFEAPPPRSRGREKP